VKVGDLVKFAGDNNPDIGAFFGIITEIQSDGAYSVHFLNGVTASCTAAEIRIINESR
jgi:hypothetical protein